MRRCSRHVVSATLAVIALGAVLAGQSRDEQRYKWWQAGRFKSELALTSEQSARIEEIFQSALPNLRATKENLDAQEGELSRLIGDGKVEEAQIVQQIERVEAARSALSKARILMLYRMHRALSAEQRAKLKTLHENARRDRREHRPDHQWQ